MNTAIIGLGNIGSRLAQNLTAGGEGIMVTDKTLAKAEQLAGELGSDAKAMSIPEAIGEADVVILAIYFDAIKDMLMTYRSDVAGKIIVDPSNPIAPDGKGGFKKTIPAARAALVFDAGPELGLYILQGEVNVGGTRLSTGMLGLLGSGSQVQIEAVDNGPVEAALIGGDPVRGDVLFFGPFVMDTPERLVQAKRDFAAGRMGRM